MPGKINNAINLVRNMGWRYISFRARYELSRRTGSLQRKFPVSPPFQQYLTLEQWRKTSVSFFFKDRESLSIPKVRSEELKQRFDDLRSGRFLMFNSVSFDLGSDYDWITNPDSGFKYDAGKHWTEIADFSKEAGDIKYVWEKSRFSYLYDIIRYDYHFQNDCAEMVFADILSWINSNPVNCGPNYRCSQEMSLRVLNWTFALYYYRNSPALTNEIFNQVQYAIYWHMNHIYRNIDFSRIAVRNNHAITETLALYLVGLLYPAFPEARVWKEQGKRWFEQEIDYQIYDDGTFLQFSMNYHRVVVQLLTWAIALSEKNGERFCNHVYEKAKRSLIFLRTCMIDENGCLPNYGANDGALFFRLNDHDYRDYRPQLYALAQALNMDAGLENSSEDAAWYSLSGATTLNWQPAMGIHTFRDGGYYVIREPDTLTFIKCGSYRDRPSQADNLHLDIWYKGENVLLDAGSYKYNTDSATMRYFSGTESHNTVMLGNNDQMLKGGNFIWYYWSRCQQADMSDEGAFFKFVGAINAFKYIDKTIVHKRVIIKQEGAPRWEIKDEILPLSASKDMRQLWHLPLQLAIPVSITATDGEGAMLQPLHQQGYYSSLYGRKEKTDQRVFTTKGNIIHTTITITSHS